MLEGEALEIRHLSVQAVLQSLRAWGFEASARSLEEESGVVAIPDLFDLGSSLLEAADWEDDSVDEQVFSRRLLRGLPVVEVAISALREKAAHLLARARQTAGEGEASVETSLKGEGVGLSVDYAWKDFDARRNPVCCRRPVTAASDGSRALHVLPENVLCGCFLDGCSCSPSDPPPAGVSSVFFALGRACKALEIVRFVCSPSLKLASEPESEDPSEAPCSAEWEVVASWTNTPAAPVSLASTSACRGCRDTPGGGRCGVSAEAAHSLLASGFLDGSLWLFEVREVSLACVGLGDL